MIKLVGEKVIQLPIQGHTFQITISINSDHNKQYAKIFGFLTFSREGDMYLPFHHMGALGDTCPQYPLAYYSDIHNIILIPLNTISGSVDFLSIKLLFKIHKYPPINCCHVNLEKRERENIHGEDSSHELEIDYETIPAQSNRYSTPKIYVIIVKTLYSYSYTMNNRITRFVILYSPGHEYPYIVLFPTGPDNLYIMDISLFSHDKLSICLLYCHILSE
ncbi:hypothetical protein AGLY_007494 [Aphis glycines]|uniref:Uncharacterized protein n=1 Tax=Aphis glycines TaxID=307491 RepID=A0A6G0TNE7_APHGL|nr:hypothetical protein AGLY_007494 [Aphis glycines]